MKKFLVSICAGLIMMWRSPTFSTKAKGVVTALFVLVIISSGTNKTPSKLTTPPAATNVEDKSQPAQVVAPVQKPAPAKFPDLGMTVAQFKSAFAAVASSYGVPQFNINNAVYQKGSVQDMLEYKFSPNVSLSCQVNKSNGLIRTANVTLIPLTDGDSAIAFTVYGILITIFNPELTQDDRNALFDELCLVEDKILALQDLTPKAIRGNKKYSVVYVNPVDSVGMLFWSVSNRDDN